MRIIDITHPPQSLWIGREGENTFRPVSFECANWFTTYPNATIAAYYQPYGSADPYPLVLVEDGTKRIWHPLLNELVKGDGELQIVLMNGDTVGTSAIIPTRVDRSLISNADHPADEAPSWTVQVVADVQNAIDGIGETVEELLPDAVEDYMVEHPFVETDPTVPAWAKATQKPSYTAAEVGALPDSYTAPVQSVNGKTGVVVLDASDVGALPDDTPIPAAVTEQTVSGWGFTKNTGTYSKPSGGIPASDLAAGVIPDISGKANTADVYTKTEIDQKLVGAMDYKGTKATVSALPTSGNETGDVWHITADGSEWAWNGSAWEELGSAVDLSGYRTASAQDTIDAAQDTAIAAKYTKPSGGIPDSDIASAAVWNTKGTYSKPSGGIPKSDLASAVQTSLGKADTALQTAPVTSVNGKTGAVTLTASDVNALPDSTVIPTVPAMATDLYMSDWASGKTVDAAVLKADFQSALQALDTVGDAIYDHASEISSLQSGKADKSEIPTAVSELTNDSGFQTASDVQTAINTAVSGKLDTAQGAANAGKFMVVGSDGNIAAVAMTAWQGGSF